MARTLVLDSSAVADIARESENRHAPSHRDACAFIDLLSAGSWLPTLSFLQISEIAQHGNPRVVTQRIRLLQRFPKIAWTRSSRPTPGWPHTINYGFVLDLIYREATTWTPATTASTLCRSLRDSTFLVSRDPSFIEGMVFDARESRQLLGSDQLARNVASLTFALAKATPNLTMGHVRRILGQNGDLPRNLAHLTAAMAQVVYQVGDARSTSLPEALGETMADIARGSFALSQIPSDRRFVAYLAELGVHEADVTSDAMTIREAADLGAFRRSLRIVFEGREHEMPEDRIAQLRPEMLPTCRLVQGLRRHQIAQGDPPNGSDLFDANIAPLALYADATIVDRRTHELLGRLLRDDGALKTVLGRTVRWSGTSKTLSSLSNWHPS